MHAATLPLAEFAAVIGNLRAARFARDADWRTAAAAGVFDVEDVEGTTLAVLSLCIDLARWYEPADDHKSAEAVGELYAGLVLRMLRRP